jgi:hypothetical protein
MAKKSVILLLVAALFAVVLVGILFFTPCGVTIEKFQDSVVTTAVPGQVQNIKKNSVPPSELLGICGINMGIPNPEANEQRIYSQVDCESGLNGIWTRTPFSEKYGYCSSPDKSIDYTVLCGRLNDQAPPPPPPRMPRGPSAIQAQAIPQQIQAQPIPQVAPSVSGAVTPQGPTIAPVSADCTPGGNTYGYPSNDNTVRLYATEGCNALGGILSPNGECMRKEGGSFSWDCRGLNPVPAAEQCNTLYPPPPPPPPTLADCSSQYSCQTTLAPIGGSMIMPSRSTPAPIA